MLASVPALAVAAVLLLLLLLPSPFLLMEPALVQRARRARGVRLETAAVSMDGVELLLVIAVLTAIAILELAHKLVMKSGFAVVVLCIAVVLLLLHSGRCNVNRDVYMSARIKVTSLSSICVEPFCLDVATCKD